MVHINNHNLAFLLLLITFGKLSAETGEEKTLMAVIRSTSTNTTTIPYPKDFLYKSAPATVRANFAAWCRTRQDQHYTCQRTSEGTR